MFEGWPQVNEGWVVLGLAIVGHIAWLSRLESKNNTNQRDIDRLDKRQDTHESKLTELDNKVMDKLSNIEKLVAEIIGSLKNK